MTHLKSRHQITVLLFSLLCFLCVPYTHAAPKKKLLTEWNGVTVDSIKTVDHSVWERLLKKYLKANSGMTLFRYGAVSTADKVALKNYIRALGKVNPASLNRNEQFAFWANLYNSKTVDLVLDHYPVSSIKRIGNVIKGPWDQKNITVNGKRLSLNNIEHGILRPIFNDQRIHYVLNCASIGCPSLPKRALTSKNYRAIMALSARQFVNHRRAVSFEKGDLTLSSIYDWYASDFGRNERAVLKAISKHAKPQLKKQLNEYKGKIKYNYNWSLNKI
ncbi:MAG: DUF547 domain-containing protein [Pseudomonadota bacterium]